MDPYLKCGIFPACHDLYIQDVHKSSSQNEHLLQRQQNCTSRNALELLTSPARPYCNNLNLDQFTNSPEAIVFFWLVHARTLQVPTNSSVSLYILSNSGK